MSRMKGPSHQKAFQIICRHPGCLADDENLDPLIDDIAAALDAVAKSGTTFSLSEHNRFNPETEYSRRYGDGEGLMFLCQKCQSHFSVEVLTNRCPVCDWCDGSEEPTANWENEK